jgi:putative glycosyltransferase (TIGR04372 family)
MTRIWITILWLWYYLDSWRYAVRVAYLRLKSRGRPRSQISLTSLIVAKLQKIFCWLGKRSWASGVASATWAFRVVRYLGHIVKLPFRRGLHFHRSITGRATYVLFDRLLRAKNKPQLIRYFSQRLERGKLSSNDISGLLAIALESGERKLADRCVEFFFAQYPQRIDDHRGAAVRCFLQGEYDTAEAIWSRLEEFRFTEIERRSLDKHAIRYLGPSWFIAIGHIAHLDTLLKYQILNQVPPKRYVPIIPAQIKIPNQYFLDLWKPLLAPPGVPDDLPVLPFEDVSLLQDEFWNLRVAPNKALMFSKAGAEVQRAWEKQKLGPLLALPEADCARGWEELNAMGVPSGSWFVCLHVRESGFHQAWHDTNPGTRNADITTYREAIAAIVARGGYVVRLGDASMTPLPDEPGLIDYALSSAKCDFMDIFLCAECRFFVGTNSGLGLIPPIFGKPCAMTNWSPIAIPQWYPNDLFIPKLVCSVADGRLLSFQELFSTPAGWAQFEKYFKDSGLTVIDNTSDEICAVVLEMMDRLDGNESRTEEEKRWTEMFECLSRDYAGYVGSRIGKEFLRKHSASVFLTSSPEVQKRATTQVLAS